MADALLVLVVGLGRAPGLPAYASVLRLIVAVLRARLLPADSWAEIWFPLKAFQDLDMLGQAYPAQHTAVGQCGSTTGVNDQEPEAWSKRCGMSCLWS